MAKILVVDDQLELADLLGAALRAQGHQVASAADGPAALRALGLDPPSDAALPDLVLLDVHLPGVDGLEIFRLLRAHDRTRTLPVVFLTGGDDAADVPGARTLRKPFDPAEIDRLLKEILT